MWKNTLTPKPENMGSSATVWAMPTVKTLPQPTLKPA